MSTTPRPPEINWSFRPRVVVNEMRFYLSGKAQAGEFTCNLYLLQWLRQRIHLQRKQQSISPTGNVWYFFHSAMSKGQKLRGQNWSIPQRYSSGNVLWANMAMTCVFVSHVLNVLGAILSTTKLIDRSCSDMDFYRLPSSLLRGSSREWQVIFFWLFSFSIPLVGAIPNFRFAKVCHTKRK